MGEVYYGRQTRVGYVWRPALFYAIAYTIFALAVKLSSGWAQSQPALFLALFCVSGSLPLLVAIRNGLTRRSQRNGPPIIWRRSNTVSGFATALIVATTVGAYLVDGVTILLALVLMRMGVIAMAPILDLVFERRVRPAAWIAFFLCMTAGLFGLFQQTFSGLGTVSLSILAVYLMAYAVRLSLMTRDTKTRDRASRGDWFLVEMIITAVTLVLCGLCSVLSLLLTGALRFEQVHLAPLIAGFAYGYALINGTLIYLDWRENAHSIMINRSASLISGFMASIIGFAYFGLTWPSMDQWILASLTICGLSVLGWETIMTQNESETRRAQRSS